MLLFGGKLDLRILARYTVGVTLERFHLCLFVLQLCSISTIVKSAKSKQSIIYVKP